MNSNIRQLDTNNEGFDDALDKLLAWESVSDGNVQAVVNEIIESVRQNGDSSVIEYTNLFDRLSANNMAELEISQAQLQDALQSIPDSQREALQASADRIRKYHEHQKQSSWEYEEEDGTVLGQQITAIDRVGVYVPGGKAAYPSSVLMNVIPAHVAGVKEIIMTVPTPDGKVNPLVLAAAAISGVTRIFCIGGAQAIAALAYGTQTVPKVDKIIGPGNIFVATAKSFVYGEVGIDMIAGPSEILIVCDGNTDPEWIAMDLFSQAEHDENAQSILISWDDGFFDKVKESINMLLPTMERADIIKKSLDERGAFIQVKDLDDAVQITNRIAPEHLELSIDNPKKVAKRIRHAGAIFMGRYTSEALGDYCAGPNHVLPTSGTTRFSSPLGVYDFQKRSSLIMCSADGASELGKIASVIARGEEFTAHARSAEYRIKS